MRPGARQAASDRDPAAAGTIPLHDSPQVRLPRGNGGHYLLKRLLHRGHSAAVWHAVRSDGSDFAIKVAPTRSRDVSAAAVDRLKSEYELLASLAHPNIGRVVEWLGGDDCMVLEYLPGGDLSSLAGAPARHWVPALRALASALEFLHDRGIVHRDVKARNVLFDTVDRARLIDFGSCRPIGSAWSVGGTTAEHRPSGWVGRVQTAGDDVYAFAVLCHELMHGALPDRAGPPGRVRATADGVCDAVRALAPLVRETLAGSPSDCVGRLGEFSSILRSLRDEGFR